MTSIDTLLREPAVQAVGWALLHFVWQGALVGIGAAAALRLLRDSAADVRYVVAAIALALMATLPVVTGVQAWRAVTDDARPVAGEVLDGPGALEPGLTTAPLASSRVAGGCGSLGCASTPVFGLRIEPMLPGLVLVWMAGVTLLALRLAGGWISVQRMKGRGATPADAPLQAMLQRLTRALHIGRPVVLLQSWAVDVPTVIGWLKPTVLLPMGALAGLSPLQVEAVLAHELAHIRRHDYFVNLLQTVAETLLFYHPAVWWLSRRIRIEREHCCDDLAVSLCGDPVIYARALADLEEFRGTASPLAMAATGGSLVTRVRRLLMTAPATHAGRGPAWLAAATAALLMGVIIATPVGRQAVDAAEPTTAPAAAADTTAPRTHDYPGTLLGVARALVGAGPSRIDGQAPPTPPTPPAPPTPPTPPTPASGTLSQTSRDGRGTISWSRNGEKLVVEFEGAFTVNGDDTDIATLSPGGFVRISDGAWLRSRSVEVTAGTDGALTRKYFVGSSERPFEPEGREWLSGVFPRFVRQTGINARERVARFLSRGGIDAVLAEITLVEGAHGKRLYFSELLKQVTLDAGSARTVLAQAGREIDSDYELATLLIDVARAAPLDDAARDAYFAAARSISSDYEMRRTYEAVLQRGNIRPPLVVSLLDAVRDISSDYEAATLLLEVVEEHQVEGIVREPFFKALATVGSSYERGRVLQRLLRRADLSGETLVGAINETATIGSDHEASQVLLVAARSRQLTGAAQDAFLRAADRLGDHERGQVLAAFARTSK